MSNPTTPALGQGQVWRKTEAATSLSATLSAPQRGLLVMVDGKRTLDEMARFSAAFGDICVAVTALQAVGAVEFLGVGAQPAPAGQAALATAANSSAPQSPADAPQAQALTLPKLQRHITQTLAQTLGPNADALCIAIERAKDATKLAPLAKQAVQMLRDYRKPAAADALALVVEAGIAPGP